MAAKVKNYLVRMLLIATGRYVNYTSPKVQLDEEMADALARHLQRNGTPSMVVALPTGEIVKEYGVERGC